MAASGSDGPVHDDQAGMQEVIDKAYALAYEYEQDYGNCPQCVVAAVQDVLGTVDDAVFQASHGLAGGAGLTTKGMCGALSGAILAVSSKYGRDREKFATAAGSTSYRAAKRLVERFVEEFGSTVCADVQTKMLGRSFDMWDRDDYKAFELAGGHKDKCPDVAGKAASWATEIILELQARPAR